ncbi:hypothetical protein [Arthrobacter sp. MA-N2]|uniref:hypothetical protein n=1 Tax=Arthrobacter sp. MA-N2 TaxID=1101188 RepID=UPI0004B4A099|nr:hypothetical protein [Arthrobacter sp. MA-N2]
MRRRDCKDIDRDAIIHELLLEAELTDASELRESLTALESFASMPAPAPGPALAAMLSGSAADGMAGADAGIGMDALTGNPAVDLRGEELRKRRQLRKNRPAVIGATVATAMALGVGGVAASSAGFSEGTPDFIQALIPGWVGWTTAPPSSTPPTSSNHSPEGTTHPAPVDVPAGTPAAGVDAAEPSGGPVTPAPENTAEAEEEAVAPAALPTPAAQPAGRQPVEPKAAHAGPTIDSRGILPLPKTAIPSTGTVQDLQDGVQQAVQSGQNDGSLKPPGASLRWLLGLLSR